MLICARLRYVAGAQGGTKYYMNMDHLTKPEDALLSDIIRLTIGCCTTLGRTTAQFISFFLKILTIQILETLALPFQ